MENLAGVHRRDERGPSRWLIVVVVIVGAVAVAAGVLLTRGAGAVEDQLGAATVQSENLASQVLAACARGEVVQSPTGQNLCEFAQQVKAEPVPGIPGLPGTPGTGGAAGRGITGTTINASGHLVITYTDGSNQDVGPVVGAAGTAGPPGRGITGTQIVDGRLVVAYTDGTTQDLGAVVGPSGNNGADGSDGAVGDPGRGIVSVDQQDGRLVITYTDGTTEDAGPLPPGREGPEGRPGRDGVPPTSYTETYSDGSTKACTRTGGPDDAPTYTCGPVQPDPTTTPDPALGPIEGG